MNRIRHYLHQHGVIWALCLGLLMLLASSADLHVHFYDHDHAPMMHSDLHDGFQQGHYCDNACEANHHHEAGLTTDVTPQWGTNSHHIQLLQVALITAGLLALLIFWLPGQIAPPMQRQPVRVQRKESVPPRLRAPPR